MSKGRANSQRIFKTAGPPAPPRFVEYRRPGGVVDFAFEGGVYCNLCKLIAPFWIDTLFVDIKKNHAIASQSSDRAAIRLLKRGQMAAKKAASGGLFPQYDVVI